MQATGASPRASAWGLKTLKIRRTLRVFKPQALARGLVASRYAFGFTFPLRKALRCGLIPQYTARFLLVILVANENLGSVVPVPAICAATYSPTNGPCLKP